MAQQSTSDFTPVQPITKDVKDDRISQLRNKFIEKYKEEPTFFVRVPGRVNLIGEHVDYCGYSVCPMAIQQDILIAASKAKGSTLELTNDDPNHKDFKCDIKNFSIDVKKGVPPEWYKYFLCGVRGILEGMDKNQTPVAVLAAVSGNIPLASGLSSSSALVSAAALTIAHINKVRMSKLEIAALCAQSERFIGTQGGGMDQAIAFLATKGTAKHIMFNPLHCEDVNLPKGAVFVIAHSLAQLNKAATTDFNQRVAECRLASQIIAKTKGLKWEHLMRLADLQKALNASLEQMVAFVLEIIHEKPYTKTEICSILGVNENSLNELSLSSNMHQIKEFKLQPRALHVFQEANRVKTFCDVCKQEKDSKVALQKLGDLMKKSHISLQQQYECSHPQLDTLVGLGGEVCFGSRLTGAGWGGCVITLTTQEMVQKYIAILKEKFYANNPLAKGKDVDSLVFATAPGDGAIVYEMQ